MKNLKIFFLFAAVILTAIFAVAFAVLPLPGQIPVLMYHFIDTRAQAAESKNYVSVQSFNRQMDFLKRFGYHVISVKELDEIRAGRRASRGREIVITFDDGHESFKRNALAVLENYRHPVMLFLISESVKRGLNGSMQIEDIKELLRHDWISIGSHSRTHPFLSQMTEEQIKDELEGSKKDLEEMTGAPIDYFAYPLGDMDARVERAAELAGYHMAFTTAYKRLRGLREGPYALTRQKITKSSDNPIVFWVKISGLYQFFKDGRYKLKTAKGREQAAASQPA